MPPVSVTGARPTPVLTADLGPTATLTTAAVLAAFAHWIPEHEAETGEKAAAPVTRTRDGPPLAIAGKTGERRDDEHQLWYVALTRARYAAR